MARLQPGG
jgi:hypothetical protein